MEGVCVCLPFVHPAAVAGMGSDPETSWTVSRVFHAVQDECTCEACEVQPLRVKAHKSMAFDRFSYA